MAFLFMPSMVQQRRGRSIMRLKESDYIQTTRDDNNTVVFDPNDKFGHVSAVGMQHKGAAYVDGNKKFIKLDDINPTVRGDWKDPFNYQYSSVSDAIVSCFVQNMGDDPRFQSVTYTFERFDNRGVITTGTASDNFLKEDEVEHILSIGRESSTDIIIPIEKYVDILDSKTGTRLDKLAAVFESDHMSKDDAKHFLVQQAGFDLLTGNRDRMNNPSNFVLAFNTETETARPVNLDYGRCLQIDWTPTLEERFDFNAYYVEEMIKDASLDIINGLGFDGLFKEVDDLKRQGFEPFNIDKQGLHDDLDALVERMEASDVPFKKFAKVKVEAFKRALEHDKVKDLWVDTSLSLNLDDLDMAQSL